MPKTSNITLVGIISKVHANAQFSVKVEKINEPLTCYLAGKISKKSAKPTLGDSVSIEVYPQDLTKGRIMKINK
jgi:translation initiation factor IF-1